MSNRTICIWVAVLALGGFTPLAHAQFAVIDAAAVARLAQQVQTLQQQLNTTRDLLSQAQRTLDAMRGGRGMEQLLAGTVRNYLPPTWAELEAAVRQANAQYNALSTEVEALVRSNAALSQDALASLSARDREDLERTRRAAAMRQATARQALTASSNRFESLQQLISAIPRATDQKAILDLQARVAVEQAMLANEQTKLYMLNQAAEAEERARRQRVREEAMNAIGSLRNRQPIGL